MVTCLDISMEVKTFKDRSANLFVFLQAQIFKLHLHVFYNLNLTFNLEIQMYKYLTLK